MANDKDVARLRQGVAVWNAWRAQNPQCSVDLSGVNLGGRESSVKAAVTKEDLFSEDFSEKDFSRRASSE